jgi:hypothetical protein
MLTLTLMLVLVAFSISSLPAFILDSPFPGYTRKKILVMSQPAQHERTETHLPSRTSISSPGRPADHLSINSSRASDDGASPSSTYSPSPAPFASFGLVAQQQGSPPSTYKDSSLSPCISTASSTYGYYAPASTATGAVRHSTPTSRPATTANVSPQPRTFSIASLLNDPAPDQEPQATHHYHRKVTSQSHHHYRYPVQEKENHHQNYPVNLPPLNTVTPDPEDEMAPPKKPNSSQRRRPVPVAPAGVDSPIESPPAISPLVPSASLPPAGDQATSIHQPHIQRQHDSGYCRESARDNDRARVWAEGLDQRGDKTTREIETATTKVTSPTTTANSASSSPTSIVPKKSFANTKSRVKTVETKLTAQQMMAKVFDGDLPSSPTDQHDAYATGRTTPEKPATPQKPKAEAAPKANNSVPRSKPIADVKEPVSAKKTIPTPQKAKPDTKDAGKARTPVKSEELPRIQDDVAATITDAKVSELDSAKKLGPVVHRNAAPVPSPTPSPTISPTPTPTPNKTALFIDTQQAPRPSATQFTETSPRGAKRSQSMSPSDDELHSFAQATKKLKITKAADTSSQSSRAGTRQPSEGGTATPATGLTQQSPEAAEDGAASDMQSQGEPHTEASFKLMDSDDDFPTTSDDPGRYTAPVADIGDADLGGIGLYEIPCESPSVGEGKLGQVGPEPAQAQEMEVDQTETIEEQESIKQEAKPTVAETTEVEEPKQEEEVARGSQTDEQVGLEAPKKATDEGLTSVQTPKKRKIVITKKSSALPATSTPTVLAPAPDPANKGSFTVYDHRLSSIDHYEFDLQTKRPGDQEPSWEDEKQLFLESPQTVVKYWETVEGGREVACDGMWKIYKIFDERKAGRKTTYQVGWIGSLDRGWEPRSLLLTNAQDVLVDWEEKQAAKRAKKEAKEEGADYDFDAEQQQQAEQSDNEDEDEPVVNQRRSAKQPRASLSKQAKAAGATAKRIKFTDRRV